MQLFAEKTVNGTLAEAVHDLCEAVKDFDGQELRDSPRFPLVCAVMINFSTLDGDCHAFSRDISATGIGLVTESAVTPSRRATLCIDKLDGTSMQVLSTCRWCRPYGPRWFVSGWEFRSLLGTRRF
ncbi:MAG: PilZ domain-containing protein [Planctomycetota bacterium]